MKMSLKEFDKKAFLRGFLLFAAGMSIIPLGKYVYENRGNVKSFLLNLQKQLPDLRDFSISQLFDPIDENTTPIVAEVDLRPKCPPVYDQKNLGSCTANVGCAARIMLSDLKVDLSRMFLYYQIRNLAGNANTDSGGQMRDIGKALANYGVCEESYYPYVVNNYVELPSDQEYKNAENYKIKGYYSISTLAEIRQTLFVTNKPVLALIHLYDSFNKTPSSGVISMPSGEFLGYHAILVVGYSDTSKYLICRNSWGTGFGKAGYFFMPYEYLEKGYAADFWFLEG